MRRDVLLTAHRNALIAVDERPGMTDGETRKSKEADVEIAQYQQQDVSGVHHGYRRRVQEGPTRDQALQSWTAAELDQLRGEMVQVKAEMNARSAPARGGQKTAQMGRNQETGRCSAV